MKPITEHPYTPELLTHKRYFWNCKTPEELQDYYKHLPHKGDDLSALLAIMQGHRKTELMVRTTIPTMDGWCSEQKACVLAALTIALRPKIAVEIGVWAGRSLLPVAFALRDQKIDGKIIGIDPYSAQESTKGEYGENEKWWGQVDHESIYEKCQQSINRFQLESYVQLIRKTSDAVQPPVCQLCHCDGNHTEQAVRDVERFGAAIEVGGIIICDDIMWQGGGVLRAIDTLENMGFIEAIRVMENGEAWNVMQRVK
jgi:predicted O-methyltransferase YrrM